MRRKQNRDPGELKSPVRVHRSVRTWAASSLAMQQTNPKTGIWALALCLISISFSACTTTNPAPIVYARAPGPGIMRPAPLPHRPAPLPLPGPAFDPPAPQYDEFTTPRVAYGMPSTECVPYARSMSGIQIWGDAITWWRQAAGKYQRSTRPAAGSVLVLRGYQDPTRGHVSFVKTVLSERIIRVDHANWLSGGEVTLDVPVIDVSPGNDWSQVRVWNVPSMQWGARIYEAEGFILPEPLTPVG